MSTCVCPFMDLEGALLGKPSSAVPTRKPGNVSGLDIGLVWFGLVWFGNSPLTSHYIFGGGDENFKPRDQLLNIENRA